MNVITLKELGPHAHVVCVNDRELLFSYETLVGVAVEGCCVYQRSGMASSRTTGKHISKWINGGPNMAVDENMLNDMAVASVDMCKIYLDRIIRSAQEK